MIVLQMFMHISFSMHFSLLGSLFFCLVSSLGQPFDLSLASLVFNVHSVLCFSSRHLLTICKLWTSCSLLMQGQSTCQVSVNFFLRINFKYVRPKVIGPYRTLRKRELRAPGYLFL
jgi:hypothetical protein